MYVAIGKLLSSVIRSGVLTGSWFQHGSFLKTAGVGAIAMMYSLITFSAATVLLSTSIVTAKPVNRVYG